MHRSDMHLKAMAPNRSLSVVADRERQKMVLDVRPANARTRTDERTAFKVVRRPRPVMKQQPAQPDERLRQQFRRRKQRNRLAARHLKVKLQMVLQVFAHPQQMTKDRNAVALKLISR